MSGRILQMTVVTLLGVSIGVATFDREFKKQRQQRLEEEYTREVNAAASLQNTPSPTAPISAIPEQSPGGTASPNPSASSSASFSSIMGLWAWRKDTEQSTSANAPPVSAKDSVQEVKGRP